MSIVVLNRPKFVPDELISSAPPLPAGRPPTKSEVWAHYRHIYPNRPVEELKTFCRDAWAWKYLEYVNFHGWRKHPDWVEGQEVIAAAVPTGPFEAAATYVHKVEQLWQVAHQQARRAA